MENTTENQKIEHIAKKLLLIVLKNTEKLLLISQGISQSKKISCIRTF